MEVKEHLAARQWLVRQGIRENITVFWDHDSFAIPEVYELRPLEALNRYCRWIAGLLGATVTRVETVEYTRFDNPPRMSYLQGQQNLYNSLRQFGGVVHRVWPPVTDGVDVILFERFRHHLDIMANGGPRSILCLMAQEKGYQAMIEAAQSEGVTVVRVGRNGEMAYYPGGHDFSVPIFWDRWRFAQKEIFDTQLNPFRAKSDFAPEHGPKKWHEGPVQLEYFDPSEELDRRVFHSFINKKDFMRNGSIVTGTYVKPGIRLNDTLVQAMDRASEVSETKLLKQPGKGTFYFNEDLEALVQQEPEVAAAVRADLESLGKLDPEDYATILWNFESHWLTPAGPPMQEVLARVVRWVEGFTKVPAKRVEVAKFVEPWVRIGQQALDWFYHQNLLDMITIRVWPKKSEAINKVLMRDLRKLAKAKKENRWNSPKRDRPPRLVVVLSEDLCFDYAMNEAQDAGISAIWLGLTGNGAYYPANTRHRMPFSTVPWNRVAEYLPLAVRDPFQEGVYTPDNFLPVTLSHRNSVPADPEWGRPKELDLDNHAQFLKRKPKVRRSLQEAEEELRELEEAEEEVGVPPSTA